MEECTQQEIVVRIKLLAAPSAIFLYTPFCGTCKLSERMLNIVLTIEPDLPIYKSNINFLPQLVSEWQIRSVPCIVILEGDQPIKYIYSMGSVDELYRKLKLLLGKNVQ